MLGELQSFCFGARLLSFILTQGRETHIRIFRGICGIWSLIISLIRMESLHELLIEEW